MSSPHSAILVCPVESNQKIAEAGKVTIARSLPACFNGAASRKFDLIVINVPNDRETIRNRIMDLCRGLRSHPETQDIPTIISMEFINREMTIKLADTGIRFMDIREKGAAIDPEHLLHLIHRVDPCVRIDLILRRLCPFLDHRQLDDACALTTCRAYRNRMVLGGKRLHEVCESGTYLYCDYYLHPRFAS